MLKNKNLNNHTSSKVERACPELVEGFMLIEMIVYIGLFSIMIGGLIVSVFTIINTNKERIEKIQNLSEINFILKKLDYITLGAEDFNIKNENELEINNPNISSNLIILKYDENNQKLTINNEDINTKNIKISNLELNNLNDIGIEINIEINNQNINYVKYLKL